MPVVSQAQRRFMFAAEEGKIPGVSPKVGADFISKSHGIKNLPERVGPKKVTARRLALRRKPVG